MKQKLVRGVIYDDPAMKMMEIASTATSLSKLSERVGNFYEEKVNCPCPNKDEFIMSTTIKAICHPDSGNKNMIIPTSLLDNRLAKQLEPIDIGDDLLDAFIEIREEKFLDKFEDDEEHEPAFEPEHECIAIPCKDESEVVDALNILRSLNLIDDEDYNRALYDAGIAF